MASEYLKWRYRDVKPDPPRELTQKEKAANWWDYHKWWLLAAAVLIAAAISIARSVLHVGEILPDYQVACVLSVPLGDEDIKTIETSFAALGQDCNGDGRVTVSVHTYVDMSASSEQDAAQYTQAARVKLMADLEACDSYFFICDDAETLHVRHEILADKDGDIADPGEAIGAFCWKDCPNLAPATADDSPLQSLFIARRGFWQDRTCQYVEQCDALWDAMTEGAVS